MGALPADKVAQWKHDGFLSPFPLLDEEELLACGQGLARYEAWRGGGLRDDGTTGASVAMAILRRQARNGALIALAGFVLVVIGFALPS